VATRGLARDVAVKRRPCCGSIVPFSGNFWLGSTTDFTGVTDATGRGGVDGKGKAKGLEVELMEPAFATEGEPEWTERGDEAGRQLELG